MTDHIKGKTIIITGAAGGFGCLLAEKTAARGANVVASDVRADELGSMVDSLTESGWSAVAAVADVTDAAQMREVADLAVERFGTIDVLVNNAGTMPLAFFADHEQAIEAWDRCIDINFKGVVHGIAAVHDQMLAQERGQIINLSSIYGNFPTAGAGVYGATKAAVNVLSESLRVESQGRIKVTTIKPTGIPATGLGGTVINPGGVVGIVGQNNDEFTERIMAYLTGDLSEDRRDTESIRYWTLEPDDLADQIVYVIDQPWGVSISDITVRASGENYIL